MNPLTIYLMPLGLTQNTLNAAPSGTAIGSCTIYGNSTSATLQTCSASGIPVSAGQVLTFAAASSNTGASANAALTSSNYSLLSTAFSCQ